MDEAELCWWCHTMVKRWEVLISNLLEMREWTLYIQNIVIISIRMEYGIQCHLTKESQQTGHRDYLTHLLH